MYLSSFRLGNDPGVFVRLMGGRRRVLVIANGIDGDDPDTRAELVQDELRRLQEIGMEVEELDLRDYVGSTSSLRDRLEACAAVWLRGGNLFLVRTLLAVTGGDSVISELVSDDALVLAGYSVAPAIAGPSLRGFERADDPAVATQVTGHDPTWEGLNLLPKVIVPHCDSPAHPATEILGRLADDLVTTGVAVVRLRDGEALVVDGADTFIT